MNLNKIFETICITISLMITTTILIVALSLISGTILWLIWPIAIPAVFPGLITSGILAARLKWWIAVCLVWIFSILIRSTTNIKN